MLLNTPLLTDSLKAFLEGWLIVLYMLYLSAGVTTVYATGWMLSNAAFNRATESGLHSSEQGASDGASHDSQAFSRLIRISYSSLLVFLYLTTMVLGCQPGVQLLFSKRFKYPGHELLNIVKCWTPTSTVNVFRLYFSTYAHNHFLSAGVPISYYRHTSRSNYLAGG